jgi:hypothetical protein
MIIIFLLIMVVPFLLYSIFLYHFVLSLFQRALALMFVTLLMIIGLGFLVEATRDVLVLLGACMLPMSILFGLSNWYREWRMVSKILQSEELLSKAKGCRLFYLGLSKWGEAQAYIGRIKEIENA